MSNRIQYLHDNLLTLAYRIGPEAAVVEIAQTRTASQYVSDMAAAVQQFIVTWGKVIDNMGSK